MSFSSLHFFFPIKSMVTNSRWDAERHAHATMLTTMVATMSETPSSALRLYANKYSGEMRMNWKSFCATTAARQHRHVLQRVARRHPR
jgi:hypothetical protein